MLVQLSKCRLIVICKLRPHSNKTHNLYSNVCVTSDCRLPKICVSVLGNSCQLRLESADRMTTRPPHDETSPVQLHDDATQPQHQQQKRAVASGWVRAALLGQVASILLATVGGCSEGLSRQVIKRDQTCHC